MNCLFYSPPGNVVSKHRPAHHISVNDSVLNARVYCFVVADVLCVFPLTWDIPSFIAFLSNTCTLKKWLVGCFPQGIYEVLLQGVLYQPEVSYLIHAYIFSWGLEACNSYSVVMCTGEIELVKTIVQHFAARMGAGSITSVWVGIRVYMMAEPTEN